MTATRRRGSETPDSPRETLRTRGGVVAPTTITTPSASPHFPLQVGQTLSQRPDIVGVDAAEAFKSLQTQSTPFSDVAAREIIARELSCTVDRLAPPADAAASRASAGDYVFARLSSTPAAVASLGQVYKATTFDGVEVAVKVGSTRATRTHAKDLSLTGGSSSSLREVATGA